MPYRPCISMVIHIIRLVGDLSRLQHGMQTEGRGCDRQLLHTIIESLPKVLPAHHLQCFFRIQVDDKLPSKEIFSRPCPCPFDPAVLYFQFDYFFPFICFARSEEHTSELQSRE